MVLKEKTIRTAEKRINQLRAEHDADYVARKVYEELPEFFQAVSDILLLKEYNYRYSPMYYNIACYISNENILNEGELKTLINKVLEDNTSMSVEAELYIIMHSTIKRYMSYKKPKSNVSLYILKNMMFKFRDYLRGRYSFYNKLNKEVELTELDESYNYHFEFNLLEEILKGYTDVAFYTSTNRLPQILKYILYLQYTYRWYNAEVASNLGYTRREFEYYLKAQMPRIIELKKHLSGG